MSLLVSFMFIVVWGFINLGREPSSTNVFVYILVVCLIIVFCFYIFFHKRIERAKDGIPESVKNNTQVR